MKTLAIALLGVSIVAGTSKAMLLGIPETGRHVRSVPAINSQQSQTQPGPKIWQFKGDLMPSLDGPLLAPFVPWHHPAQNGPLLAPFVPWHPAALC